MNDPSQIIAHYIKASMDPFPVWAYNIYMETDWDTGDIKVTVEVPRLGQEFCAIALLDRDEMLKSQERLGHIVGREVFKQFHENRIEPEPNIVLGSD